MNLLRVNELTIDKGHETGSCEEYNINSEGTKM